MATGRLNGRIALITGASRGIGRAVALRFAREGAHVLLLARTIGALEEVDDAIRKDGGVSTLIPLDLQDADAIDRMGYALFQRFGRLDVLVGNAGVLGGLAPVGHFAFKDWDEVMAVNLTANWRLIRGFDALLQRAEAGRAIFVTATQANSSPPYWGAYAASKAALNAMVQTWAAEVVNTSPLKINLIDPGIVATRLRAQAFPGENQAGLKQPEAITDSFVDLASPSWQRTGEIIRIAG